MRSAAAGRQHIGGGQTPEKGGIYGRGEAQQEKGRVDPKTPSQRTEKEQRAVRKIGAEKDHIHAPEHAAIIGIAVPQRIKKPVGQRARPGQRGRIKSPVPIVIKMRGKILIEKAAAGKDRIGAKRTDQHRRHQAEIADDSLPFDALGLAVLKKTQCGKKSDDGKKDIERERTVAENGVGKIAEIVARPLGLRNARLPADIAESRKSQQIME